MKLPVWRSLYYSMKLLGFSVSWDVSVGAVIYRVEQGIRQYLLLRYPSGHFDFARGHKEEGETDRDTLVRETLEETGIADLAIFDHPIRFRFYYVAQGNEREKRLNQKRGVRIFKEVLLFPAETHAQTVALSHEHSEFLWLPYPQALARATYANAKHALTETETFLNLQAESGQKPRPLANV